MGETVQEQVLAARNANNLRLIFRAHRANRIHGQLSIFLSGITDLDNASTLIVKRLVVTTAVTRETFIVWGVPTLIQIIQAAQRALRPEQLRAVGSASSQPRGTG